ncbi:S1C family serine protease [Paenibacillus sp. FSL R5-0345]|uniref:S1C family serine protease n=1 Tax=Paenibacillus sp. FSL R5-0345 TaxID=1536770 RepID=UPI00069438EC|nr:serine protease [Paenibacillus sp. FSL R5-0345]
MKKIFIIIISTLLFSSPVYAYNYNEPHNEVLQAQLETARSKTLHVVALTEKIFQGTTIVFGTGALLDGGYILTNEHVIAGSTSIVVNTYDKQRYDAELIASDYIKDLALLKINTDTKGFVLADESLLYVGMPIMSIGNPQGLAMWSYSEGTLLNLIQRCKWVTGESYNLMGDNQVLGGNSGGPLLNSKGELIGIVRGTAPDRSFSITLKDIKEFMTKSLP